jgi:hypothetical protein
MKSSGHSSTASGSEARDFSMFTFSHWANKLRFLIERHSKLKSEIKNENFLPISCFVHRVDAKPSVFREGTYIWRTQ